MRRECLLQNHVTGHTPKGLRKVQGIGSMRTARGCRSGFYAECCQADCLPGTQQKTGGTTHVGAAGLSCAVVPERGVEPPRLLGHTDLNRACLPIPPLGHERCIVYAKRDGWVKFLFAPPHMDNRAWMGAWQGSRFRVAPVVHTVFMTVRVASALSDRYDDGKREAVGRLCQSVYSYKIWALHRILPYSG